MTEKQFAEPHESGRYPLLWSHGPIGRALTPEEQVLQAALLEEVPLDFPSDKVAVNLVVALRERGFTIVAEPFDG